MTSVDRQVDHLWAVYTTRHDDIMITDALQPHEFSKWFNTQDWDEETLEGIYTSEEVAGLKCKQVWEEWYG